jgi:hypothetical protein
VKDRIGGICLEIEKTGTSPLGERKIRNILPISPAIYGERTYYFLGMAGILL